MEKPRLTEETALKQAGQTIKQYLFQAEAAIDEVFGEGFAKENPGLVGDCVKAQAEDFKTTSMTAAIYGVEDSISFVSGSLDLVAARLNS